MITILLVFFSFLLWNIWNETLFLKYNGIKSAVFQYDWHLYDAVFRAVLFAVVVVDHFNFTLEAAKVYLGLLLIYHVLFDLGFNYKRAKDNKLPINIGVLLHLGTNFIDAKVQKVVDFLDKIVTKISKYPFKQSKVFITFLIRSVELIIGLGLCFG
jgi:hypothetical protein